MSGLNKELWLGTVQDQLFKNDSFLQTVGVDHSGYVSNITVHIPQAGSNPTVSKNLSQFPAQVGTRTDADLTYNVDLYYSQPIRIGIDETQYLAYDKRASVLNAHIKKMSNVIGNNVLYKWANPTSGTAGSQVITTGAASGTALAPSATGTRLAITYKDFTTAAGILDGQDVDPNDDRYIIMPSALYWQMTNDTNISKYLEYGASPVVPTGKVPMIAGFKIIVRSSAIVFDNSGTPAIKTVNDEGVPSSPATTDKLGCLCVSSSYVSRALGAVDVYTKEKDPTYYGDILSATVAFGASKMRTNGEGIVSIIQG